MAKKKAGDDFPVVGLGASAGGLEAVRALLKALSPETGMAFVLVQHMDPTHDSPGRAIRSEGWQGPPRNRSWPRPNRQRWRRSFSFCEGTAASISAITRRGRLTVASSVDKLAVVDREVQDRIGRWYSLRMRPYKTAENKINGVLIALADIDALKRNLDRMTAHKDTAEAARQEALDSLKNSEAALRRS